jgi:DNA polymerase-3 subunit delta'
VHWFQAIVGHHRAKEVLARAIERGRVPPALLVTGRQGSGRFLLARELAKALNCRGQGDLRPCGECLPCKKIASGTHPDFVRLTPEEGKAALGIDQVRSLLDELALAPAEGERRVFVIDPADAMTDDAQNALLKNLEEPPARAHLVLVARHESALLKTIASRCFVLALGELEAGEVEQVLVSKGVGPEGARPAAEEARLRAAWSGGSPGVALRPQHLDRIASARALVAALENGEAQRNPLQVASELVAKAAPKNVEPAVRREGALEVTDLLGRALRDALARAVGAPAASSAAVRPGGSLHLAGPDRIAAAIEAVQKVEEAIANNQNVNLALEGLVLDVSSSLAPEVMLGRR